MSRDTGRGRGGVRRMLRVASPGRITFVYICMGVLWIVLSDPLLKEIVAHPYLIRCIRGLYTMVSAAVLFVLIRQYKALRESRHQHRKLVDLLREPILIHRDGIILDANQYAADLFGASDKHGLIGTPVIERATPKYRHTVAERIKNLTDGISTDPLEQEFYTLSGDVIHGEAIGVPVTYQGLPAVQVIIRDLTQRKRAEKNLKEVVDLFHLIEQNMSDAICVLDVDGTVIYCSPSHEHLFGRRPVVEGGRFSGRHVHEDDLHRVRSAFTEHRPFRVEFRVKHADGHWITLEMSGVPVTDEHGQVTRIVLVIRDITLRKDSEDLLRKSDRLAAVGELAAGVAHEIRNPLTSLKGFIQMLRKKATPDEERYFDIIQSEMDRIDAISSELLVLANPRDGKHKPEHIGLILQEVGTLLSTQAILNNVLITQETEENVPLVQCDQNQLKQVFVNVTKNAIEAMPEGGNLFFKVRTADNTVHVEVTDDGCGIAPEHLPRLGQPFYTTKDSGTGLGLMVSYKIIENHRGTMSIESTVGRGTTVRIALPAVEAPVAEEVPL